MLKERSTVERRRTCQGGLKVLEWYFEQHISGFQHIQRIKKGQLTTGPSSPASPFSPEGPPGPRRPASPCLPGGPASPLMPFGPSFPEGPAGPAAPGLPWKKHRLHCNFLSKHAIHIWTYRQGLWINWDVFLHFWIFFNQRISQVSRISVVLCSVWCKSILNLSSAAPTVSDEHVGVKTMKVKIKWGCQVTKSQVVFKRCDYMCSAVWISLLNAIRSAVRHLNLIT